MRDKKLDIKPKPMSEKQWEMNYKSCEYNNPDYEMTAWVPTPGKDRPTPHKKVNECDH